MKLDKEQLLEDIGALSDYLPELALRGGQAMPEDAYDRLRQLCGASSLEAIPKLAEQLDGLCQFVRAYLQSRTPEDLAQVVDLLLDCFYTCRAIRTYLQGKFKDDAALEEIFGENRPGRRPARLEARDLVEIGFQSFVTEANIRTDISYLLDLHDGEVYSDTMEIQRDPSKPAERKPFRKGKVRVRHLEASPGFAPRAVKLSGEREVPFEEGDLRKALGHAKTSIEEVHRQYRTFRSNFFAPERMPILLVPKAFYVEKNTLYMVDRAGKLLTVGQTNGAPYVRDAFLMGLASETVNAVFGMLSPVDKQMMMVPFGVLGSQDGTLIRYDL